MLDATTGSYPPTLQVGSVALAGTGPVNRRPAASLANKGGAMINSETYLAYRTWVSEPLTQKPRILVVIPAYNEEWRILPTVGAIATHMSSRNEPWELIIADDGSTDTTVDLLQDLRFPNMRVLQADRNMGKGNAVRRGMLAAEGEYVLFADADQSTPIEQFDGLLAELRDGYDVAVGSRAADGAAVKGKSLLRKILSRSLRTVVSFGFGVKISDTQCGFKLFTAEAARTLFELQIVEGFSFDLEVLYLSSKLGLRVAEVPVEWIDAPGSTVDAAKVSAQFVVDLVKIRLNDLRGHYTVDGASSVARALARHQLTIAHQHPVNN
jgi:dolichyl-phosphate beta-glucosyltransferase